MQCYDPRMIEIDISWGKERGRHLFETSDQASRMVAERITLEELGLKLINLPLCTEGQAVYIEEIIPRAKEGFALALRGERIARGEIQGLLKYTTPESTTGIWSSLSLTERQNTLPEYHHVLASLGLLLEMGRVSYFDFTSPPPDIDTNLGKTETYWNSNTTAEHLWTLMEELERSIRAALYQNEPLGTESLLKVGHFFSAGKEVARAFNE